MQVVDTDSEDGDDEGSEVEAYSPAQPSPAVAPRGKTARKGPSPLAMKSGPKAKAAKAKAIQEDDDEEEMEPAVVAKAAAAGPSAAAAGGSRPQRRAAAAVKSVYIDDSDSDGGDDGGDSDFDLTGSEDDD